MSSVAQICALLEQKYGPPEWKPKHRPLDELILTILSQNTSSVNCRRAFANLQGRFGSWEQVRNADVVRIEDAIRIGGLAKVKAGRLKRALNEIVAQHAELSLDFLAEMSDPDAGKYLMQFDGVGVKTAACVLMFSLNRPVLPVDTHVHRVSRRLGLIDGTRSAQFAHHTLQAMVPEELVYSFHVNMVAHGRKVCKARSPACDACILLPVCPHGELLVSGGA